MGQCVSSKSAALRGRNAQGKNCPGTPPMSSRPLLTPTVENNNNNNKVTEELRGAPSTGLRRLGGSYTRGVATSFGFRKRISPNNASITSTQSTPTEDNRITSPIENLHDNNGNDATAMDTTTPKLGVSRLPAPKKESAATKGVSRFGFRQRTTSAVDSAKTPPNDNATVSKGSNSAPTSKLKNINNNVEGKPRAKSAKSVTIAPSVPKHKLTASEGGNSNLPKSKLRPTSALPIPSVVKCSVSSTQLPKPQTVRVRPVEDVKTAKTAANNSRKDHRYGYSEESGLSSKEGSVTGDSGVGSQSSGAESDLIRAADLISEIRPPRPRNLGTVISPRGTFDLRDLEDNIDNVDGVVTEVAVIPLPKLPSVFSPTNQVSTGVVRERTQQYQRQIERSFGGRSVSETRYRPRIPLGDDSEEEKTYRDSVSTEKCSRNINIHNRRDSSEKPRTSFVNRGRSEERGRVPPNWSQGGEAMLDNHFYDELGDISISISEKNPVRTPVKTPIKEVPDLISPSKLLSTLSSTGLELEKTTGAISKNSCRSVLVTIEDPFAAMASSGGSLLDDEQSPQDSLISSLTEESDEPTRRSQRRNSKTSLNDEPKELTSPVSPGTPTNTSLSLSEGRDFLIDDEISDQPALTFDKSITSTTVEDHENNELEETFTENVMRRDRSDSNEHINDVTLVNDTPKRLRRRHLGCLAASVDTLSPCDSITSDDLMMDFELSQSSGINDSNDRLYDSSNSGLHSMDESTLRSELERATNNRFSKEWTSLLSPAFSNKDISASGGRLSSGPANFRSRTNTPSSVPESPRLLNRARISGAPLGRLHRPSPPPSLYQQIPSEDESTSSTAATQELLEIKSLVLKLQNVLQQTDIGDILKMKESLNSFENPLKNGLHENGLISEKESLDSDDPDDLIHELQRQVVFLQAQLEDRDRTVRQLEGKMAKFSLGAHLAKMNGEHREIVTCNAATQTDKVRPLSAGPSLLQSLPNDQGSATGLISVNEHHQSQRRSGRPHSMVEMSREIPQPKGAPLKLWRSPGEPPPPPMFIQSSSLPRSLNRSSRIPTNAISS